MKVKEEGPPSP